MSQKLICTWCLKKAKALVLNPISCAAKNSIYQFPSDYCCLKCEKAINKLLKRQSPEQILLDIAQPAGEEAQGVYQ